MAITQKKEASWTINLYKTIGILSGTFDPVHLGHIELSKLAKKKLGLDEVWLLPEQAPRNKTDVTNYQYRLEMLLLAAEEYDWLEVIEVEDEQHSIETIDSLKALEPLASFHLLVGADVAAEMKQWDSFEDFKKQVTITSFGRNGLVADFEFEHPASSKQIREGKIEHLPTEVVEYLNEHKVY